MGIAKLPPQKLDMTVAPEELDANCRIEWHNGKKEAHFDARSLVYVDGKWFRQRDIMAYRESLGIIVKY